MNLWNILVRGFRRRWAAAHSHPPRKRAHARALHFRPTLLALEDRTVPTADMFTNATVISGALVTSFGSNVDATAEPGETAPLPAAEPNNSINSVWWQWTAPFSGAVEVNTLGSELDTVLAVYTGAAVDSLTLVGANDDFYDFQSRVIFQATAGTTYHISVDGFDTLEGSIVLNLAMQPANDNFASAEVVTVGTYTGSNTGASAEPGEPNGAGTSGTINSVWWKWTADKNEAVEFNTFGSGFDTLLAVYTGSTLETLQLFVANDDTIVDGTIVLQSKVLFEAQAGTTYYIAVDGFLEETGSIFLNHPPEPSGTNHPPVIGNQTFTLNENSFGGTFVGNVVASDPNRNQTIVYDIIGGNTDGAFSINRLTGDLFVDNGAALDFEVNPTFNLVIRVTDDGTPPLSASATVTVNLVNLQDAPVFQNIGPFNVAENSPTGTRICTVTATDSDPGQTISYAITDGNAGGAFTINPETGLLAVGNPAALDFETTPVFRITVTATDNGVPPLSASTVVLVFVDDGNEAPLIADQSLDVDENSSPGTVVGQVAASDPDGGQSLTYSIIAGNDAGSFSINSETGFISVVDSAPLNFEVTPSFVLTVRVTDDGNPAMFSTAEVTIQLNNVNEAATLSAGPFAVEENSGAGVLVGTVSAADPDFGQLLRYEITDGNASGAFTINRETGDITVANASVLDFELRPRFTLTVRVTDNGSPAISVSTTVVITLLDVNDAPVLDTLGAMSLMTINQGDFTNAGTLVSDLLASTVRDRVSDQDVGAKEGIAVIAVDSTNGEWQFSLDGGSTWRDMCSVSDESARLLAADALTRVRFVPAIGFNGTVETGITFRAWDQTSGFNGCIADASVTGGRSAFSTAVETASMRVLSAIEQIANLSNDVRRLVESGALSSNDGNRLQSKLSLARRHLERGSRGPAENQINSFMNLVSALSQEGTLSRGDGEDLLAKASAVIISIWN